jgi:hypothetical protein
MSSMYTMSHFSVILSANIEFIIVWKVAGELVSPKNMTVSVTGLRAVSRLAPMYVVQPGKSLFIICV